MKLLKSLKIFYQSILPNKQNYCFIFVMPQVSVIIPNYNHALFLQQRIESVLKQTYQDFEIILLDDASTDNSRDVISQYNNHPKIQICLNDKNSGSPFKQWNKGLEKARGKYIWIAESDDYAEPNFLETLVPLLENNDRVGLAYCQSYVADEKGNILKTNHWWTDALSKTRWQHDFINSGIDECQNYIGVKNTIPNASAVLFRKDILNKVGDTEQSMTLCGDWMAWIEVLLKSDIAYSSQVLNYFRHHGDSVRNSCDRLRRSCEYATINLMLEKHIGLSSVLRQAREKIIYNSTEIICNPISSISIAQKIKAYLLLKKLKNNVGETILKKTIINYRNFYLSRVKNKIEYFVSL